MKVANQHEITKLIRIQSMRAIHRTVCIVLWGHLSVRHSWLLQSHLSLSLPFFDLYAMGNVV